MKKTLEIGFSFILAILSVAFISCGSVDNKSIGSVVGDILSSGGVGTVLSENGGTWKSQIDSDVIVYFSTTVAGRDSGQNWYNGTVTKNGKASSFIWVTGSYIDENKNRRHELFVKEGNATGTTKPSYRYVFTQTMSVITLIFTEEGSGSGAKISNLIVPNGMYSHVSATEK